MLSERTIDLVCLKAAEIHNLGRRLSDSRAQAIIDEIRGMLEAVSAAPAEGREALAWRVEWERGGQTWVRTYTNERDAIDDGQAFSGTVTPLYPLATAPTMSGEIVGYLVDDPNEPDIGHWFDEGKPSRDLGLRARPLTFAAPTMSEADAKDAARYQWLRAQHEMQEEFDDSEGFVVRETVADAWTVFRPGRFTSLEPVSCIPGELDAAIDAEIDRAAAKEQQG